MADPIRELLVNFLKRKEELAKESESLDRMIELARQMLSDEDASADNTAPPAQLGLWGTHGAKHRLKSSQVQELLDEARRLIVADGRPLKRGELVNRLEDRGYPIVGTDKNKVLGTNIWRSGKFIHIDGEGYWPSDMELPKKNYDL